jgi:mRNA-degrading endonuclease RelE of RelBE toxin-antitoxin system
MSEDLWSVAHARRAEKDIARLDPLIRRVLATIGQLAADPRRGQLRKLTGQDGWRLRVGEWRVLVNPEDTTRAIGVQRVLPHGRA